MNKYKLSEKTLEIDGHVLHRIIALRSFGKVKEGELGGWIEKESNLSHEGDCWIYNDAVVYGNAEVCDDAEVCDYAEVCGNAKVYGNAEVCGEAEVYGYAMVYGEAKVCGEAKVEKKSDYIVFKNWWSSGRYFSWTRSNDMWSVGCFYGTGEELIKKAYTDSEKKGREYERIVRYVESIKSEIK